MKYTLDGEINQFLLSRRNIAHGYCIFTIYKFLQNVVKI